MACCGAARGTVHLTKAAGRQAPRGRARGPVAQRQSRGLIILGSQVRILPGL